MGDGRHHSPRGPSSRHPCLQTIDRLRQPIRDCAATPAVRRCLLLVPEQRISASRWKRAEDALRESERESRLIVDTIPALVWSAWPDGSAEFFSQHFLDFIGLSA